MKKLMFATLALCATFAMAQEASDPNLAANAASPAVQEALDKDPDGVEIQVAEDGSYQIFARGTGSYDFDDEDDIMEARQEGELKAKAALSKFLTETVSSSEGIDSISKKAKAMSSDGKASSKSISKEQTKVVTTSIKVNSAAILTGVIRLKEDKIPGSGDSGTIQVTVGVSSLTLEAAKEIADGIADSINNRKAVTGPGTGTGANGGNGSVSDGGTSAGNKREVRKSKSLF